MVDPLEVVECMCEDLPPLRKHRPDKVFGSNRHVVLRLVPSVSELKPVKHLLMWRRLTGYQWQQDLSGLRNVGGLDKEVRGTIRGYEGQPPAGQIVAVLLELP